MEIKAANDDAFEGEIQYLNTDLDLRADVDVTRLVRGLESLGLCVLHLEPSEGGGWTACLETNRGAEHQPEETIGTLLDAVEALSPELRDLWDRCSLREFNLGYDCGGHPWAFNQGVSADLLRRISALGCSLRMTLYPYCPDDRPGGSQASGS